MLFLLTIFEKQNLKIKFQKKTQYCFLSFIQGAAEITPTYTIPEIPPI